VKRSSSPALDLEGFLPYRLSVVANRSSRALATLYDREFGLSIPEWRVVAVLGRFAPLSSNEIGDKTAMDKATISRAVARLVKGRLLVRAPHPSDGRLLRLALSAKGRDVHARIAKLALGFEAELTAVLSPAERKTLHALLDRLDARLLAQGQPPVKPIT